MLDFFSGLVVDGYFPVFRALLSFLPHVVILLTIVSLFKDSGYILGFGCTTLAISANEKNTQLARFLTFIPCSAKLPVLIFLCTAVLGFTVLGVLFLYLFAILVGLLLGGMSIVTCPRFKKTSANDIVKNTFKNILEFLKRISLGLIIAVSVLYTLQYFGMLVPIASVFEPLFTPIGLGNAQVIACLVFGLIAKEMIIGAILVFGVANLGLTDASGISFLLFTLLYTTCIPSLIAIKAKYGTVFMVKTALLNFMVAYGVSFVAYNALVLLQ